MSVRDELQRLYDRDGRLDEVQVVAEASDPTSPLHHLFVWDNDEAARRYRLVQARGLIISCRVSVQVAPDHVVRTRAFVHVAGAEDEPGSKYAPVLDAMNIDEQRDLVIAQAKRELAAFTKKYRDLLDLSALFAEFNIPAKAA